MDDGTLRCDSAIPKRGRPSKTWDRIYPHIDTIAQLYNEGYTYTWIADLFECSASYMRDMMKTAGIERGNGKPTGDRSPSWKGGQIKRQNGYISVTIDSDHPYMSMCEGRRPYLLQHRLVMAEALGRPLRSDETVHHLNGIKDDNRIENLQLMSGVHRAGVSACCADCGSYNITFQEL